MLGSEPVITGSTGSLSLLSSCWSDGSGVGPVSSCSSCSSSSGGVGITDSFFSCSIEAEPRIAGQTELKWVSFSWVYLLRTYLFSSFKYNKIVEEIKLLVSF